MTKRGYTDNVKNIIGIVCIIVMILPMHALAELSIVSVSTKDAGRAARTSFSSTESASFAIEVNNSAASSGRISFSFYVKDPAGKQVLSQTGNSAPGSAGQSGSEIRNISIDKFFTSPGFYTLEASASLDGISVSGTEKFQISSPVITLSYPPNGMRNITALPLTFRWVSSGAVRHRIYVGANVSFYNAYTETITGTSFTYPANPPNEQHTLVSGQVYYWKVVGLSDSGKAIAESTTSSFSILMSGSQVSKDIALKEVEISKQSLGPGIIPLKVSVKNQGSGPEANITVSLFVNGLPTGTPKKIHTIQAGHTKKLLFPVRLPEITDMIVVTASHDFFDDDLANNRLTRIFGQDEFLRDEGTASTSGRFELDEAWEKLKMKLNPNVVSKFDDYTPYAVKPDNEKGWGLLNLVINGDAEILDVEISIQR